LHFKYAGDKAETLDKIVLSSAYIDGAFMRNKYALAPRIIDNSDPLTLFRLVGDLMLDLGGLAPRCVHAEVSINGNYHGFYLFMERIEDTYLEVCHYSH